MSDTVTAPCDYCGETLTLTGNVWPHANGLLMCDGPRRTTQPLPPGPPGPPRHEHADGTQCMWVIRRGIHRWRSIDATGWDLGECPATSWQRKP